MKEHWGCRLKFDFCTAKLTDYCARLPELEQSRNPFALVVAAHLQAQATKPGSSERLVSKLRLVRNLYDRGLTCEGLVNLFECLDWFLALSPSLEKEFSEQMTRFEEEKSMPHITSVERVGFKRGRQEGLLESLLTALETRFGPVPESLRHRVQGIQDPGLLSQLLKCAIVDESLATFAGRLQA